MPALTEEALAGKAAQRQVPTAAPKGPPCTRQSPLILAAFRPWGGSRDARRTGGADSLPDRVSITGGWWGEGPRRDLYPVRRRIRLEA